MSKTKGLNGKEHLYFLRMNKYVALPEMQGIYTSTKLVGSFLGNPSLNPLHPNGSSVFDRNSDWVGEEAIKVKFPEEKVRSISRQFKVDFGNSMYRHHKDRGLVPTSILNPVDYHYLGIRSGLDKFDFLKSYLESKRYREGLREVWQDSFKMMEEKSDKARKLDSGENYRFFLEGEVIDFSFSRAGKYPRITFDVFAKVSDSYDRLTIHAFVEDAFERFLAGNPYKEAIRVAFSREGFGYDLDFKRVNPKQFRTTEDLPKNIIF